MNTELLQEEIRETPWNDILNQCDNVDEMCNKFTDEFIKIAKKHIPTKNVTIRPNDKPWFNSEIRKQIRYRDRLRNKALRYKREIDKINYKRQRNKVNNMKKFAKQMFENNLDEIILENTSNPKMYWKLMRMLIKENKASNDLPPLKNIHSLPGFDDIVFDDREKCELLNEYFCSVSKLDDTDVFR